MRIEHSKKPTKPRFWCNQTMDLQVSLEGLRQKINNQAGREDVVVAFDGVDKQVSTILSDISGMDLSTAGLRLAARKLRSAEAAFGVS